MSPVHPFIVMMQFAENFAYQYADRVVSMLPNALSHMREHGLSPGKFIYIPNGIDLAEWSANSTGLPALHCRMIEELKAKGRFLVGYAGAFGIANALDSVVHAARLLQDTSVTVILIGSGPEKNRLQALASRLNLKNVEFLPSVPKSAVPALLGLMDTLLISLRRCSIFRFGVSPNKLMDYMMAAKPVIQAIEAGNDLVRDSGCGISVRPEDPEEIAAAAIRMMQLSLGERIEMGKRGRAYVQTHHDYRFLSMQFLAAIEGTTPSFHPSSDPTCAQRG
jgi:glycosyltransferase involved in cell wall biosynthesis